MYNMVNIEFCMIDDSLDENKPPVGGRCWTVFVCQIIRIYLEDAISVALAGCIATEILCSLSVHVQTFENKLSGEGP